MIKNLDAPIELCLPSEGVFRGLLSFQFTLNPSPGGGATGGGTHNIIIGKSEGLLDR